MSKDINDLAQSGQLPADPAAQAKPVNDKARAEAEERSRVATVRELLAGAYTRAVTPRAPEDILTTGHWEIDRDTGGFKKGFCWVFGAKSHWGKTASAIAFADENIKRGKRVLIVSAEDPVELYGERLLMRRARVDRYRYEAGRLHRDEIDRVTQVAARGEDIPVLLQATGRPVEWAAKRVRQMVQSEGIDLVCWDYLHAFDKEKSINGDRRQVLNYIARVMTDTTKTLGVAAVIYGQVTPDTKALVPDMYEIRDSKDVVNAADVVAIGYIPTTKVERSEGGTRVAIADAGSRCIVLPKKKTGPGPSGRVYAMGWDRDHGCFDTVADPDDRYRPDFDPLEFPDDSAVRYP